jgi:hypothetical protein
MESSWAEQRAYITEAVTALGDTARGREASEALARLEPRRPRKAAFRKHGQRAPRVEHDGRTIVFDPVDGAIVSWRAERIGPDLASPARRIGTVAYQTFSQADYDRYLRSYAINLEHRWCSDWAVPDLSKPGIDKAGARSAVHAARTAWWGMRESKEASEVLFELRFPRGGTATFGAPAAFYAHWTFPRGDSSARLDLQWFDKRANRLPEAIWLGLNPALSRDDSWSMVKMGSAVSPLDVVRGGNRVLHAVTGPLLAGDADLGLLIRSLDAPLVAPGRPGLLTFDRQLPYLAGGMHVNLYNNIWGTNFPMWYDDDARFRFEFTVTHAR